MPPRVTKAKLQERIDVQEQLLTHYKSRVSQLEREKGAAYITDSVRHGAVKAASELAMTNAKLTYALSRVIAEANSSKLT